MLDWNKIDNDKTFQRLVNHLFALECDSPGFIPSSPYIGADGSWDGSYEGFYAYEKKDGVWSIQAKWTTKSFKEAVSSLKSQIKKELEKAQTNNVDHLRIATNAKLKVDQVKELQSLNDDQVPSLRVWHREELTRRIELQPFLRYSFFGWPQYPKFVPSDIYFRESEKDLLPISATKIPRFENYLSKAGYFIASKTNSILLVHSPGGYGKSHLLKEIAEIAHNADPRRQPWMVRTGHRKMEDALQEELVNGRKYLLIFDDSDRFLTEIKPLLSFCKHGGDSIKVILTARTSGVRAIYDIVKELRSEELYGELNISKWEKDELIQLLRIVTKKEKVEDEEMIATAYSNPFLIVWIGRHIRKEPTLDIDKIKEKFVNEIDYEANRCLGDIMQPFELEGFMVNLACAVPFPKGDSNVSQILGARPGLGLDKTKEAIELLEKAGILRLVGNSLRFNPDMKGDLYLAYGLEKSPDFKKIEELIQKWVPVSPEKVFINLAAASEYADIPALGNALSRMVKSWILDVEKTPAHIRKERLDLAEKMSQIVPEDCLNLLSAYLESDAPPSDDPHLKALGLEDRSLTKDDYGPIVLKLTKIPSVRRDLIEIIEKIETKCSEGIYSNYQTTSLVQDSVSPLRNDSDLILKTLDIFIEWLRKPNKSRIKLISAALSGLLAGSHGFTKATIGGIVIGQRVLQKTREICQIRDKAVHIVKMMLTSSSLQIKLGGLKVAQEIGVTRMGIVSGSNLPLSGKIAKEREEVADVMGKLISPDADFRLLNAIENLFLRWWAQDMPGTIKVKEYLHKFPRKPEYMAFRYFVSPDYAIEDFDSTEKQAPVKDRWRWFVHNIMQRSFHLKPQDFQALVNSLSDKYNAEDQLVGFLRDLDKKISPFNPWARPLIVTGWVESNPNMFLSIRRSSRLWEQVPERFKNEIDLAMSVRDKKIVEKLADEIFAKLPKPSIYKIQTFLTLLSSRPVKEPILDSWLTKLLEEGNSETRALVVFNLYSIFEKIKNFKLILRLLRLAASREKKLEKKIVNNLSFVIHHLRKYMDSNKDKDVKDFQKELLQKLKDVSELDWHSQELLGFAFCGIDSVIDFIEYRLKKSKGIRKRGSRKRSYEAIPFEGIQGITLQIKSFSDFEKFIAKVISWYEEDLFWGDLYIECLMKPMRDLLNNATGRLYIEEFIEKQLEMDNIEDAITASRFLPFNEGTVSLFIEVSKKAIASKKEKEIRGLFYHKVFPETGWSGLNEPPPALVSRKNLFQLMHKRAGPGKLRALISGFVQVIDREIEEHMKRGEEFLSPRG
jgi:hypothetical protein